MSRKPQLTAKEREAALAACTAMLAGPAHEGDWPKDVSRRSLERAAEKLSGVAVNHAEQLARALRDAVELLNLCDPNGDRAAAIDAPEDRMIEELCERIGYGAVMDSAARLWRRKNRLGAYTTGPAAGSVRRGVKEANAVLTAYENEKCGMR